MSEQSGLMVAGALPLVAGGAGNGALYAQDTVVLTSQEVSAPEPVMNFRQWAKAASDTEKEDEARRQREALAKDALRLSKLVSGLIDVDMVTTTRELTYDGITFGYRAISSDFRTEWSVFIIETYVDEERHDPLDPNSPRSEKWYGPIYRLSDLGAYLNGELKARFPVSTPVDNDRYEFAPIPDAVDFAKAALAHGNFEGASASALVSLAENLDKIIRNGGL